MLPRKILEECMKRILLLLTLLILLVTLLLTGCGKKEDTPGVVTSEPTENQQVSLTEAVPPMLIGAWRSLDPGELDMVETIEFFENGEISVNCTYQGQDAGTIYGTYSITNGILHCDMTANNAPYIIDYQFLIDGRELTLVSEDNEANYIKVS